MRVASARARSLMRRSGPKYFIILCLSLGAVTLYMLSIATANTALFARQYPLLLVLNGGLVLCLIALVGYQLVKLQRKVKAGVFGAKLMRRLVWFFALMALLPGALVYSVSVGFLAKSIDSWFDVRVDKALEGGLSLGRTALDQMLKDLIASGDSIALTLSELPTHQHLSALNQLREQTGVQEATLFDRRGAVIAFSTSERAELMPDLPSAGVLRQVRLQQGYSAVEAVADKGLQLRVVVPINLYTFSEDARMLQLLQPVPLQLAQNAETVQSIYRDYQELTLSRQGLKQLYGVTLTLALLLALLGAFALAFFLSERLSAPLGILAKGTRAVAQGDFSQQHTLPGRDELGVLTQSFNRMTQQLAEARAAAQRNQAQLETAKAYVESLLANLSAGVMSFDEAFRLRSENPSAGHLLHVDFSVLRGVELKAWPERSPRLEGLSRTILESFSRAGGAEWERQLEYSDRAGNRVLLLRGTRLPGKQADHVVVFDDITHLLEAQRHAAWSEVARRLAHEIKNPLMPIQLSAERMQRKLTAKLQPADAEMLDRSTQNIVTQVGALKSMVDAFSQYARSPGPTLQPLDLNKLVRDVLVLYEAPGSPIKLELAPHLPQINGDPNQLRQVIHNLLQNAQDAMLGQPKPAVTVRTAAAESAVQLSVIDNGSGFPEQLLARVFEPYVTTKQKGTGLGLAIVKRIVEEHGGAVSISNLEPRGASVTLSLPLAVPLDAAKKSAVRA